MITPAILLAGGRLASFLLALLQLALIARLPAGTPGVVLLHMGIMTALGTAIDLGTGQALLRLCAADAGRGAGSLSSRSRALVRTALRLRFRLALAFTPAHLLLVLLLADHTTFLLPAAVCLLPVQALGATRTPFVLQARPLPLAGTRLAGGSLALVGTALLKGAGVAAPGPYLALHAAGLALGHLWLWRLSGLPLRGPVEPLATLLPQSLLLGLGTLVRSLYYHGDTLLVRLLAGPVEVDLYAACYRLFSAATLLPDALGELLLAPLTRGGKGTPRTSWLTLTALGTVPLGLGFFLAAPLLVLCCGDRYAGSAPTLRLLLLAALMVHPAALHITRALAAGRLGAILVLSLAGLALTVLLCLLLVPDLGAAGAAWATLATEMVVLAGAALVARSGRSRKGKRR